MLLEKAIRVSFSIANGKTPYPEILKKFRK
jgi:hypothetical protein